MSDAEDIGPEELQAMVEGLPPALRADAEAMAQGQLDEDELVERQMDRMGLGGLWAKYKDFDVEEAARARRGQTNDPL